MGGGKTVGCCSSKTNSPEGDPRSDTIEPDEDSVRRKGFERDSFRALSGADASPLSSPPSSPPRSPPRSPTSSLRTSSDVESPGGRMKSASAKARAAGAFASLSDHDRASVPSSREGSIAGASPLASPLASPPPSPARSVDSAAAIAALKSASGKKKSAGIKARALALLGRSKKTILVDEPPPPEPEPETREPDPRDSFAHDARASASTYPPDFMVVPAALGGAAFAGELLSLRAALSEKELETLELRRAHADAAERTSEARRESRKSASARVDAMKHMHAAMSARDDALAAAKDATQRSERLRAELVAARKGARAAKDAAERYKLELDETRTRVRDAERLSAELKSARGAATANRLAALEHRRNYELAIERATNAEKAAARAKNDAAIARNERNVARCSSVDKDSSESTRLKGELDALRKEMEDVREKAARATARAECEATAARVARDKAREDAERAAADENARAAAAAASAEAQSDIDKVRADAQSVIGKVRADADAAIAKANAEKEKVEAEARERAEVSRTAQSKIADLARAQDVLKVRTEQLLERVEETKRHAQSRAAAAARHKATARDLRRQLDESETRLRAAKTHMEADARREVERELREISANVGVIASASPSPSPRPASPPPRPPQSPVTDAASPSVAMTTVHEVDEKHRDAGRRAFARDALDATDAGVVEEATAVLSAALRRCVEANVDSGADVFKQWMITGNDDDASAASALLAVAHCAAGALVTASAKAEEFEDALAACESERDALTAAAAGWEDAAVKADAACVASRQELRVVRATAAAADERADMGGTELRATQRQLRDAEEQIAKLDEVLRRMHARSLGPGSARDESGERVVRRAR